MAKIHKEDVHKHDMNPPLSVQDSGTDGRGWQNVDAVGAQVALGGAVGGAPVVELCEGGRG